jgi:hypothetical protein
MPWREVTTDMNDITICAALYPEAHPENTVPSRYMTTDKLKALLAATYYEPLASPPTRLPVFQLFGWSAIDGGSIEIALGFYKTIKRDPPGVPTGPSPSGSTPTRRWWTIGVGCQRSLNGVNLVDVYENIKTKCTEFYTSMAPDEELVIVDDQARLSDPTRFDPNLYLVDALFEQLRQDATVKKQARGPEPAYAAYLLADGPVQLVNTKVDV